MNDGVSIPWVGLGTYKMPTGKKTIEVISTALELGYRHFDTASFYGNEKEVGEAIKTSGFKREEIFVTTKLWNDDQGFQTAKKAFQKSLNCLNIEYIDLYLIHWPQSQVRNHSWKALMDLKKEGQVRSIGVSNYTQKHLQELFENSGVWPSVNQVEFSPFLYQKELLEFCKERQIVLQAYRPLTNGLKLENKILQKIAKKHKKTVAQVMLRWVLDLSVIILPKTIHKDRLQENILLFDFTLDQEDFQDIATLDEVYRSTLDPASLE